MVLAGLLLLVIFSILLIIAVKGFLFLPVQWKKRVLLFFIIGTVSTVLGVAIKGFIAEKYGKMVEGKIIYVVSNKIREIDLSSKKEKEIYQGSNMRLFGNLNKIDNNMLLLEIMNGLIETVDLTTKKFESVCEGEKPAFIPEINSVFYYKYKKGLYQKRLDSDKEEFITENIYTDELRGTFYYPKPPIQVSPSEIAYYTKDKKIEIYNFTSKTFRQLNVTGYEPWAFYKKKESLICKNRAKVDDSFCFVNISTLEEEKLPFKLWEGCIIPVEDYDCLIYSKVRPLSLSETKDMYIYWINEKKEQKYIQDTFLWSGVYIK